METKPGPDTGSWATILMQKWIAYMERESVRKSFQTKVIDPVLQHILKQIFPYILLICIMFVLLLFAVLVTLGVLLFSVRSTSAVGPL